ncbi:O-antigen ligase family protein [Larkinella soli]|uniref:O-antigen ligase family protein n=1 Tax=Larkinella soli TaxID=1770527 RepID=UPI000FFBCAC4|nr:O-antigen ligase family protein [Larkinella soli]
MSTFKTEPGTQASRPISRKLTSGRALSGSRRYAVLLLPLLLFFLGSLAGIPPFENIRLKVHFPGLAPAFFVMGFVLYAALHRIRIRLGSIDLAFLLYGVYVLLNRAVFGVGFSEGVILSILPILAFLLLKQLFLEEPYGNRLMMACACGLLLVGIYQCVSGELQLLGLRKSHNKLFPMTGLFHNPGPFGIFLAPIFTFALAGLLFPAPGLPLYRGWVGLCRVAVWAIPVILPATQSRSAWLGGLTGTGFLLFLRYKSPLLQIFRETTSWLKLTVIPVLIGFAVVSPYLLYQFKPNSVKGRALVWRVGWESIRTHPVFGIGFGRFGTHFGELQSRYVEKYADDPAALIRADYVAYAFNDFLQILVETGLVGFGLFGLVIFRLFRSGRRGIAGRNPLLIGSLGGILAVLVAACFSYPFELPFIWFLFLFFAFLVSAKTGPAVVSASSGTPLARLALLLTLGLMVGAVREELRFIRAQENMGRARGYLSAREFGKAVGSYRTHASDLAYVPNAWLGFGKALLLNGEYAESAAVLEKASARIYDPFLFINLGNAYQKLKKFDQAGKAYRTSILILPNKMYPRYLLAKLYAETGDTLKAVETAREVLRMPYEIHSPATRDILKEMQTLSHRFPSKPERLP